MAHSRFVIRDNAHEYGSSWTAVAPERAPLLLIRTSSEQ